MKKSAKITTKELEQRFDEGGDVLDFFDTTKAEVEDPKTQRVNVDFPEWMVKRLDDEARRLGITRQSLIKFLLSSVLSSRYGFQRSITPVPRVPFTPISPFAEAIPDWYENMFGKYEAEPLDIATWVAQAKARLGALGLEVTRRAR